MGRHVLVPLDGSSPSWAALDHAMSTIDGGTITVLHVVDPIEWVYVDAGGGYYDQNAHERAIEAGRELCAEARDRIDQTGVAATVEEVVETGQPARTIVDFVEGNDVDHVVMGSHGRSGVSRILLGSVAESVIRRAPVPVTVVR